MKKFIYKPSNKPKSTPEPNTLIPLPDPTKFIYNKPIKKSILKSPPDKEEKIKNRRKTGKSRSQAVNFSLRVKVNEKEKVTSISLSRDFCILWFISQLPQEKKLQYLNAMNIDIVKDNIFSFLGKLNNQGLFQDFVFVKGESNLDADKIEMERGSGISAFVKKEMVKVMFKDKIEEKLYMKMLLAWEDKTKEKAK